MYLVMSLVYYDYSNAGPECQATLSARYMLYYCPDVPEGSDRWIAQGVPNAKHKFLPPLSAPLFTSVIPIYVTANL